MTISETKDIARKTLTGKLSNIYIITGLYTIISLTLQFFSKKLSIPQNFINNILIMLIGILRLLFGYGLVSSIIKISKQQTPIPYSDFINDAILNCAKVFNLLINIFIKLLIPITIISTIIGSIIYIYNSNPNNFIYKLILIFSFIASFIYLIMYSLNYVLAIYFLIDNDEDSTKDILQKSKILIKGHKLKYIGLLLSFIVYYFFIILFTIICSHFLNIFWIPIILIILNSLLTPYITVSQYIFYEELNNDQLEK